MQHSYLTCLRGCIEDKVRGWIFETKYLNKFIDLSFCTSTLIITNFLLNSPISFDSANLGFSAENKSTVLS